MSVNRYLPSARTVAQAFPGILSQRGLVPFISRFVLTETGEGNVWLFVVLEVSPQSTLEDYTDPDVLKYLSGALNGLPVVISNSYGMRYAVLLSPYPSRKPSVHDQAEAIQPTAA
jgi:hypothetical protein